MPRNEWICLREKSLLTSPVMEIVERECRSSEDDRTHRFYLFKARDWCNVIPVTEDGNLVLVRQYRIGVSQHTLEIPGGVTDPSDPDLQAAALREMTEETGYAPLPGARCLPLGWSFPNPAIQDNKVHGFIVGPVRKVSGQNLDHGEMIEVLEVPLAEVPRRLALGELNHALIMNTFFMLLLKSEAGRQALEQSLREFTAPRP